MANPPSGSLTADCRLLPAQYLRTVHPSDFPCPELRKNLRLIQGKFRPAQITRKGSPTGDPFHFRRSVMPRFCTAIDRGQRCTRRARPGQPFCAGHHPHTFDPRPCLFFNERGEPCRAIALRGQDHCSAHSPRNRRAKRPATPLVPRTRRQKAQAKWLLFRGMPQSQTGLPETLPW